jgi:pyruvate,water dikinase
MRGKVLWSNVNVNENYPDPISALLYSIALKSYYFYFRNLGKAFGVSENRLNSMEKDLSAIIGTHGARMYYNLTNIYRVICALPFGKKVAGFFDAFVGVNEPIDPRFKEEKFALTGRTLKEVAEVVRMAFVTMWTFLLLPLRIRSLEKEVDLHLASAENRGIGPHEDAVMLNRLMGEFDGFLNIRFHRWRKAALADVAAMFSYGLLRSFLQRILGEKQCDTMHHTLLKGIPDIVSSEPPQMIWALAQTIRNHAALLELFRNHTVEAIEQKLYREKGGFPDFEAQLERFLKRWGFRCSGELMLTVPNFREKPAALFELLKKYIEVETESPTQIIQYHERRRKESLNAIRLQVNRPSWVLLKCLLAATHQSIAFRERVRMKQAALYACFRQTVLALGRHLVKTAKIGNASDVFFLTYGEIETYFRGSEIFPQILADLVEVRKKHFESASRLNPPDYLLLFEGEYFDGTQPAFQPGMRSSRVKSEANVFYGVSACGGRIEGKARVLENLWQASQLNAGEILVTRQTDPGWGPVFPLIKGLVMERGGMLSHGAIIAREFGIPAVVGIPKVTQLVSSGQSILVDGDEGYVRL